MLVRGERICDDFILIERIYGCELSVSGLRAGLNTLIRLGDCLN